MTNLSFRVIFRIPLFLLFLLGLLHSPSAQDAKTNLYAVGDSITWGEAYAWDDDYVQNDYPYLLSNLFRQNGIENVNISNEGQPGHTVRDVLDDFNNPHLQRAASRFGIHYVLIMIGTNDARVGEETPLDVYVERLNALIDLFLNISNDDGSHPQVILSLIPPINSPEDGEYMISFFEELHPYGNRIPEEFNPAIQLIGEERGLLVVDNYTQLKEAGPDLLPDGIHPSQEGNEMIADAFFQVLYPLIQDQSSVCSFSEY